LSTEKHIYWIPLREKNDLGHSRASVHILVGYNGQTISDFQKMAALLRETFPNAKDDEITCGTINKSRSVLNFSIITWDCNLPQGEYPGWEQSKNYEAEYYW
jgi:hypothetical protein